MTTNPFIHGIDNTKISRQAFIRPYDGEPAVFRPLSERQSHLPDHYILGCDCRIFADYAEVIEQQTAADDNDESDYSVGEIMQVMYSVEGKCGSENVHMGDHYFADAAQLAIDKISFDRSQVQRCWEISTAHVCEQANEWLLKHAGKKGLGMFFDVAMMVDVFVIKIISSPWDDENLMSIDSITAADLRQEHKKAGMPDSLINLLHLAAQAKVRFLVLDPDADNLDGLPVFDW